MLTPEDKDSISEDERFIVAPAKKGPPAEEASEDKEADLSLIHI